MLAYLILQSCIQTQENLLKIDKLIRFIQRDYVFLLA